LDFKRQKLETAKFVESLSSKHTEFFFFFW